METSKNAFLLYKNHAEIFEKLTDEQAGILIKAIFQYEQEGTMPELDPLLDIAFTPIKQVIDRDTVKYAQKVEKRKLAGAIGGKQRAQNQSKQNEANQANATFATKNVANQANNDNDIIINNNNSIDINNDINNTNDKKRVINNSFLDKDIKNSDLLFDKNVNLVFEEYEKICTDLPKLVYEKRNLDFLSEIKTFLWQIEGDFSYLRELFKKANSQKTYYDNKIDLKCIIKNHERIYQSLGCTKSPPNDAQNSSKDDEMDKIFSEIRERNSG